MIHLKLFRADIESDVVNHFARLKEQLSARYKPLIRPVLEVPAQLLSLAFDELQTAEGRVQQIFGQRSAADGEIYYDGNALYVLQLQAPDRQRFVVRHRASASRTRDREENRHRVMLAAIAPTLEPQALQSFLEAVSEALGTSLLPYYYPCDRFDELKSEGRESPPAPTLQEVAAAQILSERETRTLAIAIKTSGGLLVRDAPKQLAQSTLEHVNQLLERLKAAKLIDSEIVIVCSKTQAQVTRAPNRELLADISSRGLKCACGKPLADERMEEAIAVTDFARTLLDKARWFTVLLQEALAAVGVPPEAVLIEQQIGGDEIDCLTNISGELTLFELKDKEFNLGNAYSFGAKIAIIKPQHPVIVTSEKVGNDAREHFVRAGFAGPSEEDQGIDPSEERREVACIEGVDNLLTRVRQLVDSIYRQDAISILDNVIPLAHFNGRMILDGFDKAIRPSTRDLPFAGHIDSAEHEVDVTEVELATGGR